jgi:hypothetical protein
VQNWVADRLRLKQGLAYSVEREPHVVDEKEPDVRLRAKVTDARVAIEIKVAESWTLEDLEVAPTDQLCGRYLQARDSSSGAPRVPHFQRSGPSTTSACRPHCRYRARCSTARNCGSGCHQLRQLDLMARRKLHIFISDEQDRARSQCWYIHSISNHVYIGPEPTGGTSKLIFHAENGRSHDGCNSQWGLTRDYAEMEKQLGTPNLLRPARWKRPETPPVGSVQVASIMFPTDFLGGTIPPFESGRKRIALPLAPPRHAIEIGVFYSLEDPSTIRTEMNNAGGTFIGHMSLPSGENVAVAAREVPFEVAAIPLGF